jgi:uncharacterized membrane protein
MPISFQCSNRLLDMWDRQDDIHYICEWTRFLMWFGFYVLWQFPKGRSVDTGSGSIIRQHNAELNESRELTISLYISAFVLSMSANISLYVYAVFNFKRRYTLITVFSKTNVISYALITLEYFILNLFIVIIKEKRGSSSVSETFVFYWHFKLFREDSKH